MKTVYLFGAYHADQQSKQGTSTLDPLWLMDLIQVH
ncbi:hypothetical protein LINPERPRIM_LOCUS17074 [Linum perenne]